MTGFLFEYGLFVAKALTVAATVAIVVLLIARGARRGASDDREGKLVIKRMNDQLERMDEALRLGALKPGARKVAMKARRAEKKRERKAERKAAKAAKQKRGDGETITDADRGRRVFVLDFDGDIQASAVARLRRELSAILTGAGPDDEVVLRLESGGGAVTGYGLAASQLDRVREHRVPLTVCVDKVAASGGYMMACVADRLIAAPFAMVGSIGVVAQIPNFHRLLKDNKIDFELLTAGKYKRTLTLFGENTEEGRQKLLADIERIHGQFKQYVDKHRPRLDVEAVSTGEIWSGQDALDRRLIDRIGTSDEYLVAACQDATVLHVSFRTKRSLGERLASAAAVTVDRVLVRLIDRAWSSRYTIG